MFKEVKLNTDECYLAKSYDAVGFYILHNPNITPKKKELVFVSGEGYVMSIGEWKGENKEYMEFLIGNSMIAKQENKMFAEVEEPKKAQGLHELAEAFHAPKTVSEDLLLKTIAMLNGEEYKNIK